MSPAAKALLEAVSEVYRQAAALERENSQLRSEVKRLANENSEQCDHIFELQEMAKRSVEA